jgi:hypothetical protein
VVAPYHQGSGSLDCINPLFWCHHFGAKQGVLTSGWRFPARRLRPLSTRKQRAKSVEPFDHFDSSWKGLFSLVWKNHSSVCVRGGTNVAGKFIAPEKR